MDPWGGKDVGQLSPGTFSDYYRPSKTNATARTTKTHEKHTHIYIYIYIERESDREVLHQNDGLPYRFSDLCVWSHTHIYICIYIYIYLFIND